MHGRGMSIEELASNASIDTNHLQHLFDHPIYITEEEVQRLDETLDVPAQQTGLIFDSWGQKIEYYRIQGGQTQQALASEAGVNRGTVSRWETDKRGAPRNKQKLEKIDNFLKIPAKYRGIPSKNAQTTREAYITNAFYNFAKAIEYYRNASEQERDRLRKHLPGEHIGYFLGFVESFFRPNDDPGAFERFLHLNEPFDYDDKSNAISQKIGGKKC